MKALSCPRECRPDNHRFLLFHNHEGDHRDAWPDFRSTAALFNDRRGLIPR
jgi:hypothetical protein